jgi:peptidoglycan hydrolase-like amidase
MKIPLAVGALLLIVPQAPSPSPRPSLPSEPIVRIGLDQDAARVTVRSTTAFEVAGRSTRSAIFSNVPALPTASGSVELRQADLSYRMLIQLDDARVVAPPPATRVRITPPAADRSARIQVGDRTYRGAVEIFANSRHTLTVVNELPLEEYLLGVVPNELGPSTFGELEALKAQAVAARTYIVANLGQYSEEGYDICDTDACQVYLGAGTEDPLATQAIVETRGMVATYEGRPIKALYSSTCGGRTEASENIFEERLPYLRSVVCEFDHLKAQPFATTRTIASYREAVLAVAGVSSYADLARFVSAAPRTDAVPTDLSRLATYLRETFYPGVTPRNDLEFMVEQNILPSTGMPDRADVLFRLIERKSAFEWQQGILLSWRDGIMRLSVAGTPTPFRVAADAPIFLRRGDERTATASGEWIGGELIDFRAVSGVIEMLTYRRNFTTPSADRYSRLAIWQVHKTKQDIDTAFQSLNIGGIQRLRVVARGESGRPIATEITGTRGVATVRALRLRSLLALRDSLVTFDEERNATGSLLGVTFYGQGWGHGVGMCQVGAYGMAMAGATHEQILTKYYTGIALTKTY